MVSGHRNIEEIYIADELARNDTSIPIAPKRTHVKKSMATCNLNLRNHFKYLPNTSWQNINSCRTVRIIWSQRVLKFNDALVRLNSYL